MAIFDLKANIDLKQNLNLYTTCKQLDSLNLILSVFDNSVQADLASYNIRLKAMKADKVPLIQEHSGVSISSNVITIETDEQLTTTSGKTLIELQFIDKETGKKKATFNLVLIVVPTTLEVDRSISKATYTLLEELENKLDKATDYFANIEKVEKLNNEMKGNITAGTTLDTSLKANIISGTTLDTSLKDSITKGNTANDNLKATTENAKTSKTQLDESIKKANDFITANGDISELATKVDQNTKDIATLSNPDLFINSNFQIWQRGTNFTPNATAFEYTCDRWRIGSDVAGSIQVTKSDNGIKIKALKMSGYINFLQIIEDDTINSILGRKVTITFKLKEATDKVSQIWGGGLNSEKAMVYHANKSFTGVTSDTFTATIELKEGLVKNEFGIQIKPTAENQELEILWAKFEIGEKATPITPRPYGEELALCQRFYQVRYLDENVIVTDDSQMLKVITLPTSMRVE